MGTAIPDFTLQKELQVFTAIMVMVMIASAAVLKIYPSKKTTISTVWIVLGLSQVIFSGLSSTLFRFIYFPVETAIGLSTLSSGVVLATPVIVKLQCAERTYGLGLGLLFLGFLESLPIFAFYPYFQVTVSQHPSSFLAIVAPYIAFALASATTLYCGILVFWKRFLFTHQKQNQEIA